MSEKQDGVGHPNYYGGDTPYETIKVMEAWHGRDAVVSFCVLAAEKYLARHGKKPGEPASRDLEKAAWYCAKAAELLREPEHPTETLPAHPAVPPNRIDEIRLIR